MKLQGATALITGAGRRLGRAIALALAERGVDLILHMHSASEDVVAEIEKRGGRAEIVRVDLSTAGGAETLVQEVLRRTGKVDVLVNSAAVFGANTIQTLLVAEWRKVLRVNLEAPLILAVRLGRIMHEQRGGKIIQLGDWSGQRPVRHYLPYCVTKGGVHMSTAALAKAFAPHVQVNELILGPVLPPVDYDAGSLQRLIGTTPLRRLGTPEDVLRILMFLLDEGDFVTGASYVVDGGWLAQPPGGMETSL
ncbi:MAG: SDR family oxidoreductase [Deltaproteobacteria bacterium]|nr:SDR family oxidoreductase [Deltaproteobacteria bacterium]